MPSLGIELTFLPNPRGKWKEWRDKDEADKVVAAFNAALAQPDPRRPIKIVLSQLTTVQPSSIKLPFFAKTDPFRLSWNHWNGGHDAWCIEINGDPFTAGELAYKSILRDDLERVYRVARQLNLHPCVTHRRGDTLTEYPTGGGHLHVGIDMWEDGADYLPSLFAFEQAICMDYTNHPFIRWLFAQWFDNHNSKLPINRRLRASLAKILAKRRASVKSVTAFVQNRALHCDSISQRFASYGDKARYPTYEFRFFDMPRDVDELALQGRFLDMWTAYHAEHSRLRLTQNKKARYTLTEHRLRRLFKDLPYARSECKRFFEEIGLDFEKYGVFFERNYTTRSRFGKPL